MSDSMMERTDAAVVSAASCLAVTGAAKKVQRPGGCAGIFFQLFDWNRKFAKEKLFPKKLLPFARTKQAPRKFIADEKLPKSKHLLIAEENRGGFPIVKKNMSHGGDHLEEGKKHRMRAPGLVARLMGLETLPAVQKGRKSVKGTLVDENSNEKERSFNGVFSSGLSKKVLSPEKGSGRQDSRPQKMLKTGLSERHLVARLGADALQIKNVLSRPRKHHHHKLVSPVKSPRVGRGTSRLVDAATRILEPGLQATSHAKCAIRDSNPPGVRSVKDDVMREAKTESVCTRSVCAPPSLRRQTPCRACGNLSDDTDVKFVMEEKAPLCDLASFGVKDIFFQGLAECNSRPAKDRETGTMEVVLLRSINTHDYYPLQAEAKIPAAAETIPRSIDLAREGPSEWHFPTDSPSQHYVLSSSGLKQRVRAQVQKEMVIGEDRFPPRTRLAGEQSKRAPHIINPVDGRKDFASFKGSLDQSQLKVPSRLNDVCEAQWKYCGRVDDPLSTSKSSGRKRRNMNVGREADGFGSASLITENQRSNKNRTLTGARPRLSVPDTRGCGVIRSQKDVDVVSIGFSCPLRSEVVHPQEMNVEKGDEINFASDASHPKLSAEVNCSFKSPQSSIVMNQDALGALLGRKLKELTLQAEEESATGIISSTRTTASILKELIAALIEARPILQDEPVKESANRNGSCLDDTVADTAHQAKAWTKRPYIAFSLEGDQFSPGSVLDASLSNESCISSSVDNTLGNVLESACTGTDTLDSALSATKASARDVTFATHLLNHISMVLHNADLANTWLTGTRIDHTKWVVSNMALLFGGVGSNDAEKFVDFLLGAFLDRLATFASAAWTYNNMFHKGESLFRNFLLDCVVECLDLRYSRYCSAGFEIWSKLPVHMNTTKLLIRAFSEEVTRWILLVGKPIDEVIELEMSTCLGKWTDFEIEGFESGSDISQAIAHTLVDEMVMDLLSC
ncbi:hypothetical protein Dimus_034043 [Dionaea muscipula]